MAPRRVQPTVTKLLEENLVTENEEDELDIPASQSSGSDDNHECDFRIFVIIALVCSLCFGNYAFHRLEIALTERYAGITRRAPAGRVVTDLPVSKEERKATEVSEGCL
jgi:hypothetical protein